MGSLWEYGGADSVVQRDFLLWFVVLVPVIDSCRTENENDN
jgi:hypothetical protein